ncbi:MAG: hypothetical protein ACYDHE_17090 [Candidatus Acidiferrales bacterium]
MAASDYPQTDRINPKWIGYFAALWVLLVALSQIADIRGVVVAFTWLMVLSALMLILDPANPANLFKKVGL